METEPPTTPTISGGTPDPPTETTHAVMERWCAGSVCLGQFLRMIWSDISDPSRTLGVLSLVSSKNLASAETLFGQPGWG